jgi:integrase
MTPRAKGTGSIFKPKGSRFYWIAYVSGGKRRFEGTKSERKSKAQSLLTSRLGDTERGIVVTPKVGKITLDAGLKGVINDLRMNGRSSVVCERCHVACCGVEGHSNLIQRQIDKHILYHAATDDKPEGGYFRPDRLMSTIATSDLTSYVAARLAEGAAAASCNHEMATVRRAYRLAVQGGELATMPKVPMLTLNNARQGFFEQHEFDAVLEHLPAYLQAPLKFAFITGWRLKSEVLPLTVDRVDLQAGVVRLDVGTTKNREGRSFYLTAELRDVLQGQVDDIERLKEQGTICPFVFHRPDGTRIKDFRTLWHTACEAAGYPGKLFHDFRRSAVRTLERSGVPRSTAMSMVGHKTESIYRRYAIVDSAMQQEAAVKLDAWATEQKAKAEAERKGQVQRFEKRQAGANR